MAAASLLFPSPSLLFFLCSTDASYAREFKVGDLAPACTTAVDGG
jgi:hypothetical protein